MPTAAEETRNITVIVLRYGSFIVSHQKPFFFFRILGYIFMCYLQM